MDVLYGKFHLLFKNKDKIDFNVIGFPEVFTADIESLKFNEPIRIGNISIEDQLLYKNSELSDEHFIYVKSGGVYIVKIAIDVEFNTTLGIGMYPLVLKSKSQVVSIKQTSPLGFSVFNQEGELAFTFNELISDEMEPIYIPYDLGLTTVEYRYLQVGHVCYENYHQYISYDLFRKEFILTKKMIKVIYNSKQVELDFSDYETINFSAAGKSSDRSTIRFPAGRAVRIFHPIQELMDKNQHIHSIFEIDGEVYHLHNRLAGIYLTKGYPTRVSGLRASMIGMFGWKNLYLFGRNTHYAFQANEKYENLFIEDEQVSTFVRPLKVKLFRRYGYFKVPIKKIEELDQSVLNFHVGGSYPLHPVKMKTRSRRRNTLLDIKNQNGKTYSLKVDNRRNLVVDTTEQESTFNLFKRIGSIAEQLVPSKLMAKLDRVKKRYRSTFEKLMFNFLGKLPKKKKLVIFESFHGKQFSDSPRAIYEYMKVEKPDYNLIWSIDPSSEKLFRSFSVPYLKRGTFKWFLTFPRAKYWVNNARLPNWIKKPKGTVYLQTWHGTPLKKLGFDIEEVYMPGTNTMTYQNNFANEAKNWDYLVSPNAYSTEIFRRAFRYSGKVIESGYPRNDALQIVNDDTINKIRVTIGIPKGKKIVLYAPTWRDDDFYGRGQYKFEFQFDLRRFKEKYGDDFVLLTRMHYLVAENFDFSRYEGFIFDVSNYPDIKDLYRISDILITDYSSVFFDYSILNRPIIFYMYDLEKYRDQLRGFYFDIEKDAPGPIAETEDELFAAIDETISPSWQTPSNFERFREKFTKWEDGHAARKVVDTMLDTNKSR